MSADLADRRARRRAADREPAAYRDRHPGRARRRGSSRPGWPARTPTGGSTGSTTSPRDLGATIVRTADLAHGHRREPRPVGRVALSRARPRPSCARPPPSTASRSIAPAQSPDAAEIAERRATYFEPYHAALAAEIDAPARAASDASCSTTATRSARSSRGCSRASCRTSTSAPTAARAATPRCTAAVEAMPATQPGSAASPTAASRAAGSRGTMASPAAGVHAIQMELACRGYMRRARRGPRRGQLAAAYDPDDAPRHMRADADATSCRPACAFARAAEERP